MYIIICIYIYIYLASSNSIWCTCIYFLYVYHDNLYILSILWDIKKYVYDIICTCKYIIYIDILNTYSTAPKGLLLGSVRPKRTKILEFWSPSTTRAWFRTHFRATPDSENLLVHRDSQRWSTKNRYSTKTVSKRSKPYSHPWNLR